MSKAIQISKFGGPEVLELKEINLPKLGPKEVLLKNSSIGLNFIDTYHRSGLYPLNLPSGIGVEGSGVVIETGSDVKLFKIGELVLKKKLRLQKKMVVIMSLITLQIILLKKHWK